jgi:hypothetical protein
LHVSIVGIKDNSITNEVCATVNINYSYPNSTSVTATFFDINDHIHLNRLTVRDRIHLLMVCSTEIKKTNKELELTYSLNKKENNDLNFPDNKLMVFGKVIKQFDGEHLGVDVGFPLLLGIINKPIAKKLQKGDGVLFRKQGWVYGYIFDWDKYKIHIYKCNKCGTEFPQDPGLKIYKCRECGNINEFN